MKIRTMLTLALFVALAAPALAQTHPCDATPPNNPNVNSPVKVAWCVRQVDVTITSGYRVYMDGATSPFFAGNPPASGAPSATGMVEIVTPPLVVPSGPHSFTVTALSIPDTQTGTVKETLPSIPYPFGVIALPAVPIKPRIVP